MAYSVIVLLLSYFLIITVLIYGFGIKNTLISWTIKILPLPAAMVDGSRFITISALENNLKSVRRFYENQDFSQLGLRVDFTTLDGKKRLKIKEKNLLNRMVENLIIEMIAKEKGIQLTDSEISAEVNNKINESGNRTEIIEQLQRLYGWSISEFEENIVKPDLYQAKLTEYILNNDPQSTVSRKKIGEALREIKDGRDFEDIAKKYSDGYTTKDGGSVGWFSAEQMLPSISEAVIKLSVGQTSEIIESPVGYHIIKLTDKKNEDNIDKFQISQIFAKIRTVADLLQEKQNNIKIYIPLKGLYWNEKDDFVDFNDQSLKKFEDNIFNNSPDDASLLFW